MTGGTGRADEGSALTVMAREIIEANLYMVLGTADPEGLPWTSPVYYAFEDYLRFYWVSAPEARHSRNISLRPQISIVVFDSTAPIGRGRGVYMSAIAREITGSDREASIAVFSRRSLSHGGDSWRLGNVEGPQRLRLYGARAVEQFILGPGDVRMSVTV